MKMTFRSTAVVLAMMAAVGAPAAAQAPPAVAPAPTPNKSTFVERVLVRVNGEIFTQSQLTSRQIETLQELNRPGDTKLEASIAEVTPGLLVAAVDELLLVQRGREMGVKFSDDQFKTAIDNIKKDNKLDDAGLKVGLAQAGLTLELLRQRLERSYLVSAVQQREIGPSLSITVEEMRQFYERNKAKLMTPLTITLRELMVGVPTIVQNGKENFIAADDAAAKVKIDAVRARALAGEDFVKLVAEVSEAATKANGGLIGPINADDLNPALKDAVAALQPRGVTEPFRGPRGYQIFMLEARSLPTQKPFETVRGEIERDLREERIEPETEKLLTRLRAQAVIEWKDENYRKLYEKALADQAAP
jgi:peptidyl-prolyl cis-trans isomerase SurA